MRLNHALRILWTGNIRARAALSLKEEIELLELEGSDVRKSKIRVERAEKLYHEAKEAMKDRNYSMVRAKMRASYNMIEKGKELLDY